MQFKGCITDKYMINNDIKWDTEDSHDTFVICLSLLQTNKLIVLCDLRCFYSTHEKSL